MEKQGIVIIMQININEYINKLVEKHQDIKSIWLIGSRANGTEKEDSDWDLLVFATEETLHSLKNNKEFCKDEIDLLVVYNGNDFQEPWTRDSRNNKCKSGNLKEWSWKKFTCIEAQYTIDAGFKEALRAGVTEWTPREEILKAQKLWPN
ncbi:MAG: nucleotidyltransferase domain-containing protein [Candidatus Omnitrophota bacterium]|nr:nucleotidyltransferase domain-containing protein [Candidatus Omnitrophota bacterium]